MDWIYDAATSEGVVAGQVSLAPLVSGMSQGNQELLRSEFRGFQERGWINFIEAFGDDEVEAILLPGGRQFVETVRARRADLGLRRRAARDAVLYWSYDQHVGGTAMPNLSHFWQAKHSIFFYAQQFGSVEVDQATAWLRDKGLVTGMGAMGAGGLIRLKITTLGEELVETGGSVNDLALGTAREAPPSITVMGSTGVVIQSNSPGAHQQISQTITQDFRDQVMEFAEAIRAGLGGANPTVDANELADEIQSAANQDAPGPLRVALSKAQYAIAGAIGTAIGDDLWNQLHPLLRVVGLG